MALTPDEQIQLLRLQNKALELPAAPAMAPTPTMAEFEKKMKELLSVHGAQAPMAPALEALQAAPPAPAPTPEPPPAPAAQQNVNWMAKFADVAMAGLNPEQLGRLTRLGMTASSAHGSQGAMEMIAAAVL